MSLSHLTINLGLPDGIGDAPESGQNVEEVGLLGVGGPGEEHDDDDEVDQSSAKEDGNPENGNLKDLYQLIRGGHRTCRRA